MAYNTRWSVPCLLLAALALLASTAIADTTITKSLTTTAGQSFDNYVFTIGTIPKKNVPVRVNVVGPVIGGGGLTLIGWEDNSIRGEYSFSYSVNSGSITDSSIVIRGGIPADGVVTISNMQTWSKVQMPAFDFGDMRFTNNLTMTMYNSWVQYSEAAVNQPVVQAGGTSATTAFDFYSTLHIVGATTNGGSCVLNLAADASSFSSISISDHSAVSVNQVSACGLQEGVICVQNNAIVSSDSMLRAKSVKLSACTDTTGATARNPKTVLALGTGTMDVLSSSMLLILNIDGSATNIIEGRNGIPVSTVLGDGSILSIEDIAAKAFCTTCGSGFPTSAGTGSYVYAKGWKIGGVATDQYNANNLGKSVPLTSAGRDSSGACRASTCLPTNTVAASSASVCRCQCTTKSNAPMCLDKPDPDASYVACTDRNCASCIIAADTCDTCFAGYTLRNRICIRIPCEAQYCRQCETNDRTRCALCAAGYGLINGVCAPCDVPYCSVCDGNRAVCTECFNGYQLSADRKKCISNNDLCQVPHCSTCETNNNNRCSVCNANYGLTKNKQCVRCADPNCRNCNANPDVCTSCNSGYTLTKYGTCSPGPCNVLYCAYCDASNPNICTSCIKGYIVNTNDGTCVREGTCVVEHCLQCASGSANVCHKCEDGYSRDPSTGGCVSIPGYCKVPRCVTCVNGNPNYCDKCESGYSVSTTGQCANVGNCRVYYCTQCEANSNRRCRVCWQGYGLTTEATCVRYRPSNSAGGGLPSFVLALAVLVASGIAAAL